jgi:very-short-patch-repair endonuclease
MRSVTQRLTLHPDLANPILGIAVEADSYTHHGMEKVDFLRDCERYNALTAAGWRVLRFAWEQVMGNRDYVIRTLQAVIEAAA